MHTIFLHIQHLLLCFVPFILRSRPSGPWTLPTAASNLSLAIIFPCVYGASDHFYMCDRCKLVLRPEIQWSLKLLNWWVVSCMVTICATCFLPFASIKWSPASEKSSHFFCYNVSFTKLIKRAHCYILNVFFMEFVHPGTADGAFFEIWLFIFTFLLWYVLLISSRLFQSVCFINSPALERSYMGW